VLFLHGLGDSGDGFSSGLGVAELAKKHQFSWVAPDGDFDTKGRRFWNAWQACCDFDRQRPNHVFRLKKVIEEAAKDPKVDPNRIWVFGFSNGGFMAHRLACEVGGIDAIVSVAGVGPTEAEPCAPPNRVRVLQIHGDTDSVVAYGGGHTLGQPALPEHASARSTILGWAKRQGCGAKDPERVGQSDLVPGLAGDETVREQVPGCPRPIELWTVKGGGHGGLFTPLLLDAVFTSLGSRSGR
jgi:polyhydroxybutyrate depolymerase